MLDSGIRECWTLDSGVLDSWIRECWTLDSGVLDSGIRECWTLDSGVLEIWDPFLCVQEAMMCGEAWLKEFA